MFNDPAAVPLLAAALAFGYLLGSIPFGLLLTRVAGLGDIRAIGSGNIGATNVLRTGNKPLAAATLVADALKATVAILVAGLWGKDLALAAALGAFCGHLFPVWLRFKGGKGVATYIGILLGLYWPSVAIFAVAWLGMAYFFRYSSLAALTAAVACPIGIFAIARIIGDPSVERVAMVMAVLSAIVIAKHHENIRRLLAGTELKIGEKKV